MKYLCIVSVRQSSLLRLVTRQTKFFCSQVVICGLIYRVNEDERCTHFCTYDGTGTIRCRFWLVSYVPVDHAQELLSCENMHNFPMKSVFCYSIFYLQAGLKFIPPLRNCHKHRKLKGKWTAPLL